MIRRRNWLVCFFFVSVLNEHGKEMQLPPAGKRAPLETAFAGLQKKTVDSGAVNGLMPPNRRHFRVISARWRTATAFGLYTDGIPC